jgi:ribulose 1,5-bisphosphate carboxylase large subunit-like protein
MISDNSYEAFEKRVNLLLSANKEVEEHYKKLKEKYMNIQENPAKIVANKIYELLEK